MQNGRRGRRRARGRAGAGWSKCDAGEKRKRANSVRAQKNPPLRADLSTLFCEFFFGEARADECESGAFVLHALDDEIEIVALRNFAHDGESEADA